MVLSPSSSPLIRASKRLPRKATAKVILLILAAVTILHLTIVFHLSNSWNQSEVQLTPSSLSDSLRFNSIGGRGAESRNIAIKAREIKSQEEVSLPSDKEMVLKKVVYVAHVSVPLADQKGSDGRLEQVLDVLSTLLHDPTKQLAYIGQIVERGQNEAHVQRLRDKFHPGMVVTQTGWEESALWEAVRLLRENFAPCDELLVFFWPTTSYWQWISNLVRIVREEMGHDRCKVTMMVDESFWDRWRLIQQQISAEAMAKDYSWVTQDWRLLRVNLLHFFDGAVDKIALINPTLMDEYARVLPTKSDNGLFLLPYVGANAECPLPHETEDMKSGLLLVSGPQRDYIPVLHDFVIKVLETLPDRVGTLHVVGALKDIMEQDADSNQEMKMLLNHPRLKFHGRISEVDLEILESKVIAALSPAELSLGGISTKIIRSMSRCVAIVYAKNSLPSASTPASLKLLSDIQSKELGVACDSNSDFACFRRAILRLSTDTDHRSRIVREHRKYVEIEFSKKKLASNVLHWLGMQPTHIDKFSFRSAPAELPPITTKTAATIDTQESKLSSADIAQPGPLLRKSVRGIYITALLKDVSEIFDHFEREIIRFIQMAVMGTKGDTNNPTLKFESVFIKFVTSNNEDNTEEKLKLFEQKITMLRDSGILPSGAALDIEIDILSKEQDGRFSTPRFKHNRPAYLAHMRNRAINRLENRHSHVLFINDIITTAEDMMQLIMTRNGDYDMACAMDFKLDTWTLRTDMSIIHSPGPKNLTFYDVWVARTTQGLPMTSRYPWFSSEEDIRAMEQHQPVQVFSCWNGMVAIKSKVFLQSNIKFRTENHLEMRKDATRLAYSEAYVIGADMWDHGLTRVFVNPCIQVAYDWPTWEEINRSTYYNQCQERMSSSSSYLSQAPILTTQPKKLSACSPIEQLLEERDSKGDTVQVQAVINEPEWNSCGLTAHQYKRSILFRGQFLQHQSKSMVNRNFVQGLFGMTERFPHMSARIRVLLDGEPHTQVVHNLPGVPESERSFLHPGVVLHDGDASLELSGEMFDLCVSNSWPPNFTKCPASRRTALWLAWEYGHLPKHYVPLMNSQELDEIWVPSSHSKRYFIASGVNSNKIFIVPGPASEELHPQKMDRNQRSTSENSAHTTTIVYIGSTMPRKGLDLALRAYEEEFTVNDPVCFHVYTGHSSGSNDATEKLRSWQNNENRPCLRWINDHIPRDELLEHVRNADILLQPYRSEGFGTTLIEAMLLGTPVITTIGGISHDIITRLHSSSNALSTITLPIFVNSKDVLCTTYPCKLPKNSLEAEICVFNHDTQKCKPMTSSPIWRSPDVNDIRHKLRLSITQKHSWRRLSQLARASIYHRFSSTSVARHVVKCHIDSVQSRGSDCRRRW